MVVGRNMVYLVSLITSTGEVEIKVRDTHTGVKDSACNNHVVLQRGVTRGTFGEKGDLDLYPSVTGSKGFGRSSLVAEVAKASSGCLRVDHHG